VDSATCDPLKELYLSGMTSHNRPMKKERSDERVRNPLLAKRDELKKGPRIQPHWVKRSCF
jgi:hypothetical protein